MEVMNPFSSICMRDSGLQRLAGSDHHRAETKNNRQEKPRKCTRQIFTASDSM